MFCHVRRQSDSVRFIVASGCFVVALGCFSVAWWYLVVGRTIQNYLMWRIVMNRIRNLPQKFVDLQTQFNKVSSDQRSLQAINVMLAVQRAERLCSHYGLVQASVHWDRCRHRKLFTQNIVKQLNWKRKSGRSSAYYLAAGGRWSGESLHMSSFAKPVSRDMAD